VRVGRPGLGEQVVTVVEHRHQPQVGDRGERGAPRAQHHPHVAPGHGQEVPVPLRRLLRAGEDDVPPLPQHSVEHRVPASDVARVGHAHDAAAPGVQGGQNGLGDRLGGVVGRQRGPAGPRLLPGRQRGDERRSVRPRRPGVVGKRRQRGVVVGGRLGLRAGVPWRDGEPQDVAERAGPAVGHRAAQPEHRG
jgi:hypothetical protein